MSKSLALGLIFGITGMSTEDLLQEFAEFEQAIAKEPSFDLTLVAKTKYCTFQQPFSNIVDYLTKAKELEEMGFEIQSWYDKDYLGKLS